MKKLLAVCGLLFCGALAAAADPTPTPPPLDKTPLPPGPWVARMPAFSMWRILFTYAPDKAAAKPGSGEKIPPPDKISNDHPLPPRAVVIVRTKPIYHVAVVDQAERTSELWFDGLSPYLLMPGHPAPSLPGLSASGRPEIPAYLDYSKVDFPDVGWVSKETYLGTLKGDTTSFWVFKQDETGPTVWINADTHLPARWQNVAGETRKFEYLDAPTEKLVLPPAVMDASKYVRGINEVNSHRPPRGS